jgi:Predicted metalloprotease
MDLEGRRESTNVEDRRGKRAAGVSLGIGGTIIVGLIALLMGRNPSEVLQTVNKANGGSQTESNYTPTAEEEELASFTKKILASTEDVWSAQFKKIGQQYVPPKLVMFTDQVQSACGNATAAVGPFYCSADQTVYIDLSFFSTMRQSLGADGDFAYAYVIAHEVGHHVQNLRGTLSQAHQKMAQVSEKESNQISVRTELQADYYAGVWAHHENQMFGSLEDGDLEEAINTASVIGDDYLQKKARGYATPESFNHGTSQQRMRWLKKGFTTGDINGGTTFQGNYSDL